MQTFNLWIHFLYESIFFINFYFSIFHFWNSELIALKCFRKLFNFRNNFEWISIWTKQRELHFLFSFIFHFLFFEFQEIVISSKSVFLVTSEKEDWKRRIDFFSFRHNWHAFLLSVAEWIERSFLQFFVLRSSFFVSISLNCFFCRKLAFMKNWRFAMRVSGVKPFFWRLWLHTKRFLNPVLGRLCETWVIVRRRQCKGCGRNKSVSSNEMCLDF